MSKNLGQGVEQYYWRQQKKAALLERMDATSSKHDYVQTLAASGASVTSFELLEVQVSRSGAPLEFTVDQQGVVHVEK